MSFNRTGTLNRVIRVHAVGSNSLKTTYNLYTIWIFLFRALMQQVAYQDMIISISSKPKGPFQNDFFVSSIFQKNNA